MDPSPLIKDLPIRSSSRFANVTDDEWTSGNPFQLVADTPRFITLNGNGAAFALDHGLPHVWDFDNNTISGNNINDVYMARLTATFVKTGSGQAVLDFWVDVNDGAIVIAPDSRLINRGTAQKKSLTFLFWTGSTFLANGGKIALQADRAFDIYDLSLMIAKLGAP